MGLFEGGISYTTYFVEGQVDAEFRSQLIERLNRFRFVDLTADAEEDVSFGWVPAEDMLKARFDGPSVFLNQYAVFSLRVDRWSIPALLLKAALKQVEREAQGTSSAGYLSRTDREQLLQRERAILKEKTLPSVRSVDVGWNVNSGELRFSSQSRPMNELFIDLFERTTQFRLVPDNPYSRALNCNLGVGEIGKLAEVEPSSWSAGG